MNIKIELDGPSYPPPEAIKAIQAAAYIIKENPGLDSYVFPIYLSRSGGNESKEKEPVARKAISKEKEWLNLKESKALLGPKVCADTFLRFADEHDIKGQRTFGTSRRYYARSQIENAIKKAWR